MDAFFDLKDLTHLECLGFQMIPIARRSNDSTAIINFIARTLQTVKSSGTSVQVILSLRASELSLCDWSPVDQAISETPRDVTLEIRALVPSLDKENEQEVVTTTVGVKFPKSQEQSKVIVRFEEFGVGILGVV
ncbi:hypothetical protein MPER_06370 [Moniliophthora perniciosa FA553]|nr:hypothetical protein MPER_06370 [Moniliophthora perniciosa FA553]